MYSSLDKPVIVNGIRIEKPIDVLKLPDNKSKEQGFRELSQKLYEKQPGFMKRGTERWNFVISYDPKLNQILWDGHPIPGSKRLHSNCDSTDLKKGNTNLVLMVKNEGAIIERALESIIHEIDGFTILDTGSTDDTVSKMWNFLHNKHKKLGEIYYCEFYDFGSNRSIVSQLAFGRGEWLLLYDADYVLVMPESIKTKYNLRSKRDWPKMLPPKSTGIRSLLVNTSGQLQYSRPHIVDGSCRWSYYCRTHEYLGRSKYCPLPEASPQSQFDFIQIDHVGDGGSKADKAPRDIVLLLMDLYDNPKSERAYFYLGNSLMGAGMYEWAIRCYSKAMNFCGWFEEMYISAKEMLGCFRVLEAPWERRIAMLLHGMFQNPHRLELLTHFIRDLRQQDESIREEYTHLVCSIAACFTHNQFPHDQKLFIDRLDHEIAYWAELALLCKDVPQYFSLGCFAIKKALNSTYINELDSGQQARFRDELNGLHSVYQHRLQLWDESKVFKTTKISDYLIQKAHSHYAKREFRMASCLYEEVLCPVVSKTLVPEHLAQESLKDSLIDEKEKSANSKKFKLRILNDFETAEFHCWNPLTAWKAGESMYHLALRNRFRNADSTDAVACYQLALCKQELNSKHKFAVFGYLGDALKFVPAFAPATTMLYEMTRMQRSDVTRAVTYLIRLCTLGRVRLLGKQITDLLQQQIDPLNDGHLDSSEFFGWKRDQKNSCLLIRSLNEKEREKKQQQKRFAFRSSSWYLSF